MTETTDTARPVFRALDLLLNEHEPTLRRRSPYWAPKPPPIARECHVPAWSWDHPLYDPSLNLPLTYIDANASFVSAASSAGYAHGALEHTGALRGEGMRPGYYLVDAHPWQDDRIVSPLGQAETGPRVWIAYPTLEVIQRLARTGYWPEVAIHDSWTCPDSVRFRAWATAVNNVRCAALRDWHTAMVSGSEADEAEAYDWYENGVKLGYSQAFQMMLGPGQSGARSKVRRPDWYHTTLAQAAANTWRKTWKCVLAGYVPVRMGSVDEVAWLAQDFASLITTTPPLLAMDNTGFQMGTWAVKPREHEGRDA